MPIRGLSESWRFDALVGGGGQAIITIPAGAPTVVHVCDIVQFRTVNVNVAAGIYFPQIQILDGGTLVWLWNSLLDLAVVGSDGDTLSPGKVGTPGTSMTIRYNVAGGPTVGQMLQVEGHDA